MNDNSHLSKHHIANSFSRFAGSYEQHAFVQKEIGKRLIEKTCFLKRPPLNILDLGAGPGSLFGDLRKAFPKANIVGIDLAWGMAHKAKKGFWKSLTDKTKIIQADMEAPPFKPQSFDLIISNCAFQWGNDLNKIFNNIHELLREEGSMFFSSFGPDTLKEVKKIWASVDNGVHVHPFIDMHHYGDEMLKSALSQPVVSAEHLIITYTDFYKLLKDLKFTGARNLSPNRRKGLTTPGMLDKLKTAFENEKSSDGNFPCTYEVVYGHAIKPINIFSGVKPTPLYFK